MEAQAISALVVAFLQRGLAELNNTACALTLISDQAADILDDNHSLYAGSLRSIASTINEQASGLEDDLRKMMVDPQWNSLIRENEEDPPPKPFPLRVV